MTWRLVYASEVGTSHGYSGAPCQDSSWAKVDTLPNNQTLLSIFVADGAGSARLGGEGAELAMEAAAKFIADKIGSEFGLSDGLARELAMAVRQKIRSAAEESGLKPRDYACTLLGVLVTPHATLAIQIGDGAVVIDVSGVLELAVTPMAGEYANQTHFVTDDDAVDLLQTKLYPERAARVAAFTDGIQRLALNMATNKPHEGFFAPFFGGLAKAAADQEDQLHELLRKFLNSTPVNDRTDDDKTLALAVWVP